MPELGISVWGDKLRYHISFQINLKYVHTKLEIYIYIYIKIKD